MSSVSRVVSVLPGTPAGFGRASCVCRGAQRDGTSTLVTHNPRTRVEFIKDVGCIVPPGKNKTAGPVFASRDRAARERHHKQTLRRSLSRIVNALCKRPIGQKLGRRQTAKSLDVFQLIVMAYAVPFWSPSAPTALPYVSARLYFAWHRLQHMQSVF